MTEPARSNPLHTNGRALVSWSGGKDSCLALHLAAEQGLVIDRLVTVFDESADRSRSHALPGAVIAAQAAALGVAVEFPRASWAQYEATFIDVLRAAAADGITHAVFGDIDLAPHREWEEKVCAAAGIIPVLPLWHWPRTRVVEQVFARGMRAVVVGVNERQLDARFCGRAYDAAFIAELPAGVDACGENGEFHTAVLWAPRFARAVDAEVDGTETYVAPAQFGGDRFTFARLRLCG